MHVRYTAPYALAVIFIFLTIPSVFVNAANFAPGSYVGMPGSQCEAANDSWHGALQAAGKPTLGTDADIAAFRNTNAASLATSKDGLVCGGFAAPEQRRQKIGIGMSFAITSNQVGDDQATTLERRPDTAAFLLDKSFSLRQPNAPSPTNLDGILRVDISKDKGASWQSIHTISESMLSNAINGGYMGITLPNGLSGSFDQLSVRVQGLREGDINTHVYIDSVFLVYQVAPGQRLALKSGIRSNSSKPLFAVDQPAAFKLEVDRQGEGIVQGIASQFSNSEPKPSVHIAVNVKDASGHAIDAIETTSTWEGKAINGNDVWNISLHQPNTITPGTHTATVTLTDDTGNVQSIKQDFLWGVLAINTHKSMYQPGETVHFDMAVLNEKGEMTCDANVQLLIEGPHSAKLSTDDKTIIVNKECQERKIVEKPDYSGQWVIPKAPVGDDSGTYTLTLSAKTANGTYTITDSFRVGDAEPITVTRAAPTRIMPANRYAVRMKVVAEQQDFTGVVTETLPRSFLLSRYDTIYEVVDGVPLKAIPVNAEIRESDTVGEQVIAWNVSLKKGTTYELRYGYKAPDISPEFYLTGPLTFKQQDATVFSEHRQWQIASDAPWLTGWQYRKALTIDQTVVDADLTNFPVLVRLTSSNFDFSKADANGLDIRFTSSDMVTTLSYERERHSSTSQKAEYWVKIPSVSGTVNTVFYLYYGNTEATDGQNATGVWDTSYRSVMHLKEQPSTTCSSTFEVCDSTSNGTNADMSGGMLASSQAEGKIGGALTFDGVNDTLNAGDVNALDGGNALTISAWVNLSSLKDFPAVVGKYSSATSKFLMQVSGAGQGTNNDVTVSMSNGNDISGYTTGNILSTGTWAYWTMVYDGRPSNNNNKLMFFFNGVQQTLSFTSGSVATTLPSNTGPLTFAQYPGGQYLPATLDEVRISTTVRPPEWIKAAYNSDNGTLISFSTEEVGNLRAGTPVYNKSPIFHNARTNTTTPTLGTFWSVDGEGDMIQYEVQWDDDPTFGSPVTRSSANYATNGFSAASYDGQYQPASYTIEPGEALTNGATYWWRVRALDVGGTGTWSSYSAPMALTINTSTSSVNQWHETTKAQFEDDQAAGVKTFGADNISLTPLTYRYIKWEITGRRGPSANSTQAAEFALRYNNASVAWPAGTTATNPGGSSPVDETPNLAIDGVVSSKWLDFNFAAGNDTSLTGNSVLLIDTGVGNSVTFSGYYWSTANDFPERDPVTWNVYGSNDGTNWSLVDARSDQTITTTRDTFTSEFVNDTKFDYRYLQLEVTKRRAGADGMQFSELQMLNNGSGVSWPSGTTATSTGAVFNTGEEPTKLIDNSTATKFLDSAFSSDSSSTSGRTTVTIDTGANKSIRFDDYRLATANDANARDPISWKFSGSNDGTNWTTIDIKEDYPITASRTTYTSAVDTLAEPGAIMSESILFSSVSLAESWNQLSAATTEPSSSNVLVRVYYATSGTTCNARVPDAALAGNSSGLDISSGAVNLSSLNTSTYSVLCIGAKLRPGATTVSPSMTDWTVTWDRNTEPSTPTTVGQTKTDTTAIATGTWINESTVRFTATANNAETGEAIQLCVEAQPLGVAFTGTETGCGSGVTYTGTPVSLTATLDSLPNNTEYHWQAWTKDIGNVHNFPSSPLAYGGNAEAARDFAIDTTAPTGGTVYDGTTVGVDASLNDSSLSALSANWSGIDASPSGLVRYEYSIGTTIGGTDVKDWTNINTATSVTATGLTLQTSKAYYFNIRAVDSAGNTQSPPISSNGQLVAPSLSFAASPATMSFDTLNLGNNYSDTKTTTLTTSTNAYGGYVVRLSSTDYLRSGVLTMPAFSGGTYDFPDSWQPGDVGFGYTSSDTSIQGVNKFQAATCPGGSILSAPGCYAPYSQAKPGDIVADHAATISGTPLVNQQFTITHRVTAAPSQRASTYSVVLIYAATATY